MKTLPDISPMIAEAKEYYTEHANSMRSDSLEFSQEHVDHFVDAWLETQKTLAHYIYCEKRQASKSANQRVS